MIAAVKFQDWSRAGEGAADGSLTAGEWMAESYYLQSKSDLEPALEAARKATEVAPDFGYAWVRMAELEFSFGRTRQALSALGSRPATHAVETPRAMRLRGFLLSAQNRIGPAREAFNEAIALDGALGNAWLGRGLTYIRQGQGRTRPPGLASRRHPRAESLDPAQLSGQSFQPGRRYGGCAKGSRAGEGTRSERSDALALLRDSEQAGEPLQRGRAGSRAVDRR